MPRARGIVRQETPLRRSTTMRAVDSQASQGERDRVQAGNGAAGSRHAPRHPFWGGTRKHPARFGGADVALEDWRDINGEKDKRVRSTMRSRKKLFCISLALAVGATQACGGATNGSTAPSEGGPPDGTGELLERRQRGQREQQRQRSRRE